MDENLENEVKEIIAEQLGVEPGTITLDSKFTEDLGADSLDRVELIMNLEEKYNFNIPDEKVDKITMVREVIDYIKENYNLE